jgi:hypothetical protein
MSRGWSRKRLAVVLLPLAVLGIALVVVWSTSTGTGRAPFGFYGVVLAEPPSPGEWTQMRNAGVQSVRVPFAWNAMQPAGSGPIAWAPTDQLVAGAAGEGMQILPFVGGTPAELASDSTTLPVMTATQRRGWESFLRALVGRYGPSGSFWQANPNTPYRPVRAWQIWNEENTSFFARPASPSVYDRLLQLSSQVLRGVDPHARVVIGGMLGRPAYQPPIAYPADLFLEKMYRAGSIRGSFSSVGLHPYSGRVSEIAAQARAVRRVLAHHHDSRKQLVISEISWGAGPRGSAWLAEGPGGQARLLTQMYEMFLVNRTAWRVSGVYWFSWRSHPSVPACVFCATAGLLDRRGHQTPALAAYRHLAR